MSIIRKIKRAVRGDVALSTAALETLRRGSAAIGSRRDRAKLELLRDEPARLRPPFDGFSEAELVNHFKSRTSPKFLSGFSFDRAPTNELLTDAERVLEHRWPLLGLGEQNFGSEVDWHRDSLSGISWPREYHADVNLSRGDGSDVRLVWELNRLNHFVTLAQAFASTRDERLSHEFFAQVHSWREQNPLGYGVNWNCAMEVALRSINVLTAFEIFRQSPQLNEHQLKMLLTVFDQHGRFIKQNLEFSYIATSNHYLSDVVGLVWLGVMLPELQAATEWRDFGLREMLREMDKQVLGDGADFEASTGYHRFVTELLLYTLILCRANGVDVESRYWEKINEMLRYIAGYTRSDGRAPLIGDTDGGQVLPVRKHDADDHSYLLPIGAALFNDPELKLEGIAASDELMWTLGEDAVTQYENLSSAQLVSCSFPHAGIHVLRNDDLYLLFNTSDAGIYGRGSHGHNDALSIEVGAYDTAFIVDPGTYAYTGDLGARHLFRSTAYHSTIEVDSVEQNITPQEFPFLIGNEAKPKLLNWETGAEFDRVSAEHYGYQRLPQPVTHRRTVTFEKDKRQWLIEDELLGSGLHDVAVRFHFSSGLRVEIDLKNTVTAKNESGRSLIIHALDIEESAKLEDQFTSRNYGSREPSRTACWRLQKQLPCKLTWLIVPGK